MSALFRNFENHPAHCTKPALALRSAVLILCALALLAWPLLGAAQLKVTPDLKDRLLTSSVFKNTILIVGDSLSAEYGLKRGTGWVPLLDKQIAQDKKSAKVINASISGDTTSGGRSRLPALLTQHKPSVVVIELGGNDALRGLPLDMTEKNIAEITQLSKKAGAKVLIVGMQVPPNYGGAYGTTFSGLFAKVAKAERVALVPFFLKGIADVNDSTKNFQADRIHPNEASQPAMLANVWAELKKLLK